MNDTEYEATKARVEERAQRWIAALGLRWWRVHLVWMRDMEDAPRRPNGKAERLAADTHASWQYMEATVRWFLPVLADMDDEELDYIVRHELAHILVNEMRWVQGTAEGGHADDDSHDHEERVCTMLGKAFGWVKEAARAGDLLPPHPQAEAAP